MLDLRSTENAGVSALISLGFHKVPKLGTSDVQVWCYQEPG